MIIPVEPQIAASPGRAVKLFARAGYDVGMWGWHGPAGFRFTLVHPNSDHGSVIVSQSPIDDLHVEWLHASIAWTSTMPTYDDLVLLKQAVFGLNRTAYQVFPSADQHVNIHPFALHLWGRADGHNDLPDFGFAGSI